MNNKQKIIINKLPILKKLYFKKDDFTKIGLKKNIIPPTFEHLIFLYNFIKKNKRISCLEVGVGWSTLIIAKALEENKKKFSKDLNDIKNIFKNNYFINYTLDAENKYLRIFKKFASRENLKNIKFKKIDWQYKLFKKNKIFAKGKKLPGIIPDLIYLDGPNPKKIKNKASKFENMKDLPIIIGDLLFYENFLNPGCAIIIEGRAHNASFLKKELSRNWKYKYISRIDTHILILKDKISGKLSKKLNKFYKK